MVNKSHMLELSATRQTAFWSLIRSTPVSLLGTLVLINLLYPAQHNFIFLMLYIFTFGSNIIFKYIAQHIYKWLRTDYIPFIGQGSRPCGAFACSSFVSSPLIPASSFGMPSGHSQLAWFFAVYACLTILHASSWHDVNNISNNLNIIVTDNWLKNKKIFSCIALVLLAFIISYSRVHIEHCHTTGQVIIGGLIGSGIALCSYSLFLFWAKAQK